MKKLTVLYDKQCPVCRRVRYWLEWQPAYVPLVFLPLQSDEVERRFPGISRLHPEKEIVVIGDTGDVWQGGAAWVMCLWALREYREWSQRFAHPALLPLARRACTLVSANRYKLSRWFSRGAGTDEMVRSLEAAPLEDGTCSEGYCKPGVGDA